MDGVGDQRDGIGRDAIEQLGDDKEAVERDPDGEGAVVRNRAVVVARSGTMRMGVLTWGVLTWGVLTWGVVVVSRMGVFGMFRIHWLRHPLRPFAVRTAQNHQRALTVRLA